MPFVCNAKIHVQIALPAKLSPVDIREDHAFVLEGGPTCEALVRRAVHGHKRFNFAGRLSGADQCRVRGDL